MGGTKPLHTQLTNEPILSVRVFSFRDLSQEGEEKREKEIEVQARSVLSGMIYGYSYDYRPSDRLREIDEEFTLIPLSSVLSGELFTYGKVEYITEFRYLLKPHEVLRRASWKDRVSPTLFTQGVGETQEEAFSDALKSALRNHLRSFISNKPHSSTGHIYLVNSPRFFFLSGRFTCQVSVGVDPVEVQNYESY